MEVLLIGILVVIPAFFAAVEVALIRIRPSRVARLLEEGKEGAKSINRLQRRMRRALMLSQLGISIPLVSIGWISKDLFQKNIYQENFNQLSNYLIFISVIFLVTLFSGLVPKALVLNRPDVSARQLAPVLETIMKVLGPFLYLLEKIATYLLRLLGLRTKWDSLVSAISAGELETLIETGKVTGLLPDEKNILEGVFALRDTQVREVMVPRSGMVTLPREVNFAELMREVHKSRHARFIVTGESLDDVLGVLDLRQLAEPISKGKMLAETSLEPYIQPAPRVLETATLDELLPLIKNGNPLILVIDEHGGTEGLITATDLTGEIVGDEIQPEIEEPFLLQLNDNPSQWIADGDLEIIELNRQLELNLPESDNHHTLAGFLLEKFQRIPNAGQKLTFSQTTFDILSMEGPRINRVKINLDKNSLKDHQKEIMSDNS